ncbi:MAG: sensor histidine kinase [Chloroflexota bacterium]
MKLRRKLTRLTANASASLSKWHIKVLLAALAFAIVIGLVYFTQALIDEIVNREQKTLQLYANIYKDFNQSPDNIGIIFFLDEVTTSITFPMVVTDSVDAPKEAFTDWSINTGLDTSLAYGEQRLYLQNLVYKMGRDYRPIVLTDENGKVVEKIYYTHSALIDVLQLFPIIAILIIGAFIFIGYLAFSSARKNEESKVWVGMAKEAAHQLGTPLSSLMAWMEILKYSVDDPKTLTDTLGEMGNDVERLSTIAKRFSKIGSQPEKARVDLSQHIENVCKYYEKRLPHLGKKISIKRTLSSPVWAYINTELMDWVIENLLKNAAEAIEAKTGSIHITMGYPTKNIIRIYVKDTGKGMSKNVRRNIFNPGYTTKKRGWGLGLNLCKRIIENYHNGRIYVKETAPGKGSTFAIELPDSLENA